MPTTDLIKCPLPSTGQWAHDSPTVTWLEEGFQGVVLGVFSLSLQIYSFLPSDINTNDKSFVFQLPQTWCFFLLPDFCFCCGVWNLSTVSSDHWGRRQMAEQEQPGRSLWEGPLCFSLAMNYKETTELKTQLLSWKHSQQCWGQRTGH